MARRQRLAAIKAKVEKQASEAAPPASTGPELPQPTATAAEQPDDDANGMIAKPEEPASTTTNAQQLPEHPLEGIPCPPTPSKAGIQNDGATTAGTNKTEDTGLHASDVDSDGDNAGHCAAELFQDSHDAATHGSAAANAADAAPADDDVGIDILEPERDRAALDLADGVHHAAIAGGRPRATSRFRSGAARFSSWRRPRRVPCDGKNKAARRQARRSQSRHRPSRQAPPISSFRSSWS